MNSDSPDSLWHRVRHHRPTVFAWWAIITVIFFAFVVPVFSPYRAEQTSNAQFLPPSAQHWCGTDVNGRDMLTRLASGAQLSLVVGLTGALVSLLIGVSWGAVAGYCGGRTDALLMRLVDLLYALPSIVLVIVLVTTFEGWLQSSPARSWWGKTESGPRLVLLLIGLGSVSWLTTARIVRGQVLTLKNLAYVEAAQALGLTHRRILWRHILPGVWSLVFVYLTLTVPAIILAESFLSFLGLGVPPPMASWGSLIAEGAGQLNPLRIYWWLIAFPSSMLALTMLALTVLGEGLRAAAHAP